MLELRRGEGRRCRSHDAAFLLPAALVARRAGVPADAGAAAGAGGHRGGGVRARVIGAVSLPSPAGAAAVVAGAALVRSHHLQESLALGMVGRHHFRTVANSAVRRPTLTPSPFPRRRRRLGRQLTAVAVGVSEETRVSTDAAHAGGDAARALAAATRALAAAATACARACAAGGARRRGGLLPHDALHAAELAAEAVAAEAAPLGFLRGHLGRLLP